MITSMISSVLVIASASHNWWLTRTKKLFISDRFGYGISCCSSDDEDDDSDPDPDDILRDMFPDEDDDYWTESMTYR